MLTIILWICALPLILASVNLFLVFMASFLPEFRRQSAKLAGFKPFYLVIVPAHNEEEAIGATIDSIQASIDAAGDAIQAQICVIADNCSDKTAQNARKPGVIVHERFSDERGKGFALDYAIQRSANLSWTQFVVIDADTEVDRQYFKELTASFAAGHKVIQGHYGIAVDEHWRSQLMAVAWSVFNFLRPLGRSRMGGSAPILGNGFAASRSVLHLAGLRSGSVVEDLEWGLNLVSQGQRVHFAPGAVVRSRAALQSQSARPQRQRWEAGRVQVIKTWLPRLISRGHLTAIEAAWDLSVPPITLLFAALMIGTVGAALLGEFVISACLGLGVLNLVALTLVAVSRSGVGLAALKSLFQLPRYLLWKLSIYFSPSFWVSRQTWVRTPRS